MEAFSKHSPSAKIEFTHLPSHKAGSYLPRLGQLLLSHDSECERMSGEELEAGGGAG